MTARKKYQATCPACGEQIAGGSKCGCGNLQLSAAGIASTRQHSGEYRMEPNVVVVEASEDDSVQERESVERGSADGNAGKSRSGSSKSA